MRALRVLALVLCLASPLRGASAWEGLETICVPNGGPWGAWSPMVECPYGNYASGMSTRVEEFVDECDHLKCIFAGDYSYDNTGLNAVSLECFSSPGMALTWITPHPGYWGDWGAQLSCLFPEVVVGYRLRVLGPRGACKYDYDYDNTCDEMHDADDTAVTAMEVQCATRKGTFTETLASDPIYDDGQSNPTNGLWGNWTLCSPGKAVVSIQVKVEEPQGTGLCGGRDDTTLNDVRMQCAK